MEPPRPTRLVDELPATAAAKLVRDLADDVFEVLGLVRHGEQLGRL